MYYIYYIIIIVLSIYFRVLRECNTDNIGIILIVRYNNDIRSFIALYYIPATFIAVLCLSICFT